MQEYKNTEKKKHIYVVSIEYVVAVSMKKTLNICARI